MWQLNIWSASWLLGLEPSQVHWLFMTVLCMALVIKGLIHKIIFGQVNLLQSQNIGAWCSKPTQYGICEAKQ